jgi:hypothetical protein
MGDTVVTAPSPLQREEVSSMDFKTLNSQIFCERITSTAIGRQGEGGFTYLPMGGTNQRS